MSVLKLLGIAIVVVVGVPAVVDVACRRLPLSRKERYKLETDVLDLYAYATESIDELRDQDLSREFWESLLFPSVDIDETARSFCRQPLPLLADRIVERIYTA